MIKTKILAVLTFLAAAFLFETDSYAQGTSQTIRGTVTDKQTQVTIPGVTVSVIGTDKKVVTDATGRFRINGVSPGRYDISFTFIGYALYVFPNVEVTSGKEIVLDIGLSESANILNESTPLLMRCAIRVVKTFVLPLPAPATIIIGPVVCSTAWRWLSFSPSK